jgi:hypothetical protein
MISPKFRIADLIVLVLFAGLVAFAIREDLLVVVVSVVFIGSVSIATVGRCYRQGPRRAAWSTFALVGWLFIGLIVLSFWSSVTDEEPAIIFCAAGFLGACFSAYVAGRLAPREETGPSRGGG